jgi:hypothetical protein
MGLPSWDWVVADLYFTRKWWSERPRDPSEEYHNDSDPNNFPYFVFVWWWRRLLWQHCWMGTMGVEPIGLNRLGTDYPALNREILVKTVSPYLSAEALGLKEEHRQALIGLAADLANHRIPDDEWQITDWDRCICGHLKRRTGVADKCEFTDSAKPFMNCFKAIPWQRILNGKYPKKRLVKPHTII